MASQSGARGGNDLVWTKNLRLLPKFTTEQIQKHLEGCGKKDIGSKRLQIFHRELYSRRLYCARSTS